MFEIDVLGTKYVVKIGTTSQIGISAEHLGECRIYAHEILVRTDRDDCSLEELTERTKQVLAHELFHAYLNECGLDVGDESEELLADWFMKVYEKLFSAIKKCQSKIQFDKGDEM